MCTRRMSTRSRRGIPFGISKGFSAVTRLNGGDWSYFWFLVALVLFMAVVALIFYRTLLRGKRRNSVTSGEPVVPGGISPSENERVRNHFDAIANRRFASSVPNA